jgi:hypothetical protein
MTFRVPTGTPLEEGLGADPLAQYTRIFVRFLQEVFANPAPGQLRWTPDPATTEVLIVGESTSDLKITEKRAAIVVSRGGVTFTNVAIDQFAGPLVDPKTGRLTPNLNTMTGARRHTDLLAASMTYNCLAREGLEAQRIAWMAAAATRYLKRELMKLGIHRVGEDLQVGPESPPGSIMGADPKEATLVSVSVPFFFQQTWTREPLDKTLLTRVSLALRSEVGVPVSEPVLRGPGMYGRLLQYENTISLSQVVVANTAVGPTPKK